MSEEYPLSIEGSDSSTDSMNPEDFVRSGSDLMYPEVLHTTHDNNKSKLDKAEMKRLKWNEYMRNYSAKKRKEREERMHKVMISINGKRKLYDEVVINNILIDSFNLFIQILNTNNVLNDSTLICAVNACNDDIEKLYNLILPIVDKIINPHNYEVRA